MKKLIALISLIIIIFSVSGCGGYKPIFAVENVDFHIVNYSIEEDKALGRQIYTKLYSLSKKDSNNPTTKLIDLSVQSSEKEEATVKDNTGKIKEYKISLRTIIKIKDYLTDDLLINEAIVSSSAYKIQNTRSETLALKNKTIDTLLNNNFEKLLVLFSKIFE